MKNVRLRSVAVPQSSSGRTPYLFWSLLLSLLLVVAGGVVSLPTPTASAAAIPRTTSQVTDCSATSDGAGGVGTTGTLANALANYSSGDTIQFVCSGGTGGIYTITIPSTITVTNTLTLDGNGYNVTLDGNHAVSIINVNSGSNFSLKGLTLAHGVGTANNCGGSFCGGGIYNSGTLTVTNSSFVSNSVGDAGNGGAIFNIGTISSISNSSFVSNSAGDAGYGGAIYNNATISSISNSSFVSNSADTNSGGAIYNNATISSLKNSLLAHGTTGNNCVGTSVSDGGGNLSDDTSCGFSPASRNNVTNLNLGPLANNGGPTQTIALLANSAALFASLPANCLPTDQRGQPRPQPAATACDVGAFESSLQLTPTLAAGSSPNPALVGQSVTLTATVTGGNGIISPTTGSVIFTDTTTSTELGLAPLDSSGNASLTTSFGTGGNHNIAAGYSGSLTFTSAITNFVQSVTPFSTSLTLTSAPNPSVFGQSVTFTATVAPITASGSVIFSDTTTNTSLGSATVSNGVATITTPNLAVGSHTVVATYSDGSNFSGSTSNSVVQVVNPAPVTTTTYTYYLPLLANNATTPVGQTTTYLTFQNLSTSTVATITVQYYGFSSGTPATTDSLTLPAKGQKAILPNLATGSSSTGIISSSQPLNVVVSEAVSSGGSAYTVSHQVAATLYSPLALNGAFGGFTTSIIIFNTGSSTSSGQVQFYDASGQVAATQTFQVSAHASQVLNQAGLAGLSNSQSYWAKISATNSADNLTAQVIEFGPSNFVATFNAAVPSGAATTLYAPAAFNGLYGYVTGMGFANPNSTAATITVTYYDLNGNSVGTQTLPIAANGNTSLYQGAAGTSANVASAVVTSTQPVVMTVNERGPNNVSGTYTGISSGSTSVALPVVANGFAGFVTGATIFNAGNNPANLTLTYLDGSGNPGGNLQSTTNLAPHASFALYQGAASQGLSSGYFGTALISSNQPLLVTTNALQNGTGLFYTYTEPSN